MRRLNQLPVPVAAAAAAAASAVLGGRSVVGGGSVDGSYGAVWASLRGVAAYPSPPTRSRERKTKKAFNYLTAERLVQTPKQKLSRKAVRNRDDVSLHRKRSYREAMLRDIEEKIHYFSPAVKEYVFFPRVRSRETKKIFRGNRSLPVRTFTRIYMSEIVEPLCSLERRQDLIALMEAQGIEPPTAAEFKRYSDPTTGAINVPLVYSRWVERHLHDLGRRYSAACALPRDDAGNLQVDTSRLSTVQLFVLRHCSEGAEDLVPSLRQWSRVQGPLDSKKELLYTGHRQESVTAALVSSRREITRHGRQHVQSQLDSGAVDSGEYDSVTGVQFEQRMREMSARLCFAAKVTLAIDSLPEVKAMQTPSKVFLRQKHYETIVKQGGLYFPPSPYSVKDWRALSPAEQQEYYCFKKKAESGASSGLQLYTRYCTRDYGITRADSAHRFSQLTDEQQAALNFPFYYPITPKSSAVVAFRKFYTEMCARYGLTRRRAGLGMGNRVFEAAMRRRWRTMSPEERQRFFNDESIMAAFPLQPASTQLPSAEADEAAEPWVGGDAGEASGDEASDVLEVAKQAERTIRAGARGRRSTSSRAPGRKSSGKGLFVYDKPSATRPHVEEHATPTADGGRLSQQHLAAAEVMVPQPVEEAVVYIV